MSRTLFAACIATLYIMGLVSVSIYGHQNSTSTLRMSSFCRNLDVLEFPNGTARYVCKSQHRRMVRVM
jgi:hypothetical protein